MAKIQKISLPFTYTTEITVYEKGIVNSDNSNKATWTPPEGYTVTSVVTDGTLGSAVKGENNVEYTLSSAVNHPFGSGKNYVMDSFVVSVTETSHEEGEPAVYSLTVNVKIIDNIPSISSDGAEKTASTDSATVTGTLTINYGSDSENGYKNITVNSVKGTEEGGTISFVLPEGTLSLTTESGAYSFTVEGEETKKIPLRFVITDSDGDTAATVVTVTFTGTGELEQDKEYKLSIPALCNLGLQLSDVIRNYAKRNNLSSDELKDLLSKYSDIGTFALDTGIIENENQKKFLNYAIYYSVYDSLIKLTILDLKQTREEIKEQIKNIRKGIDEVLKQIS